MAPTEQRGTVRLSREANRRIAQVRGVLAWLWSHNLALTRLCVYSTAVLVAGPFFYHVAHGSNAFLGLLEDDYYYYGLVADNLIETGKLTYDGVTVTNGFHPLWLVVVALLRVLSGGFGPPYYIALATVFVLSIVATYELGRTFALALGASPRVSAVVTAVYSFSTAQLLTDGMECVLAVPLFLWMLIELARLDPLTSRRAAKLGLVSSLAILARLDIALLVPLFVLAYIVLVRPSLAAFARVLSAFCAGGLLVPLYVAANLVLTGSPIPVSALAKRLVTTPGFSFNYARGIAFGTVYGGTLGVVLTLGLIACLLLVWKNRRDRPIAHFVCGLTLVYAFIFFGLNAQTGWIYFGWYAFPLVPATIAALVAIVQRWGTAFNNRLQVVVASLLVALAPALAVPYFIQHGPLGSISDNTLVAMSYDLASHLNGRQGLFAMGAIAGIATYVIDRPFLQIEGIMADHRMVEHISSENPLGDVLREYGADYLIVSLATVRSDPQNGCYLVTQPNAEWAGMRTAKMRGEICAEPVEHFFTPRGSQAWAVFPTIETLVWDLRDAQWKALAAEDRA
jgi:hypothetical protein